MLGQISVTGVEHAIQIIISTFGRLDKIVIIFDHSRQESRMEKTYLASSEADLLSETVDKVVVDAVVDIMAELHLEEGDDITEFNPKKKQKKQNKGSGFGMFWGSSNGAKKQTKL